MNSEHWDRVLAAQGYIPGGQTAFLQAATGTVRNQFPWIAVRDLQRAATGLAIGQAILAHEVGEIPGLIQLATSAAGGGMSAEEAQWEGNRGQTILNTIDGPRDVLEAKLYTPEGAPRAPWRQGQTQISETARDLLMLWVAAVAHGYNHERQRSGRPDPQRPRAGTPPQPRQPGAPPGRQGEAPRARQGTLPPARHGEARREVPPVRREAPPVRRESSPGLLDRRSFDAGVRSAHRQGVASDAYARGRLHPVAALGADAAVLMPPGYMPASPGYVPAPLPGYVPAPLPGYVPAQVPGYVPAPIPGYVPASDEYTEGQTEQEQVVEAALVGGLFGGLLGTGALGTGDGTATGSSSSYDEGPLAGFLSPV